MADPLETPHEILAREASSDAAASFLAWRKQTKTPLTERAAVLIAKTLREITGQGGDADRALDLAQEHGWRTIKPDWYWRIENGNGNHKMAGGRGSQPDATAREIAFAARANRASDADSF